jgi:hypothetical protein
VNFGVIRTKKAIVKKEKSGYTGSRRRQARYGLRVGGSNREE